MHFASLLVSWPSRSVALSVGSSVRPSPPLARMPEIAAGGNPNLHGERQGGVAGGRAGGASGGTGGSLAGRGRGGGAADAAD